MVVTEKGEITVVGKAVEKAVGRAMDMAVVRNVGDHAVSTGQTPMGHDGKESKCVKSSIFAAAMRSEVYDTLYLKHHEKPSRRHLVPN